jgi:hypothetical protein
MLTDGQDSVDVELVRPGMQGPTDTGMYRHAVCSRQLGADVIFEDVVDMHVDDINLGRVARFVRRDAFEKFGDNGVGVRPGMIDRTNRGNSQSRTHSALRSG